MANNNLKSKYLKPIFKPYKKSNVKGNIFPNVLGRRFAGWGLNEVLTSDLTYVPLGKRKFGYVCFIVDLFNNEIVGHSVSLQHNTKCVLDAFKNSNADFEKTQIFHSDRGGEFRSTKLVDFITNNGIIFSMSNAGTPYDNAISENLFGIFKREWAQEQYDNIEELQAHVDNFVIWYNNIRLHSKNHYISPVEFKLDINEKKVMFI